MTINFDCIRSLIEEDKDIGFNSTSPSTNNETEYYVYNVYGNIITFTVKKKNIEIFDNQCQKYCSIIEKSEYDYILKNSPNKLKKILEDIDKCIIKDKINGCGFDKEECFKKLC